MLRPRVAGKTSLKQNLLVNCRFLIDNQHLQIQELRESMVIGFNTAGQTLFALRCAGYQNLPWRWSMHGRHRAHRACSSEKDQAIQNAIHSPFTLSGRQAASLSSAAIAQPCALAAGLINSCLNQIAITQSVRLCASRFHKMAMALPKQAVTNKIHLCA